MSTQGPAGFPSDDPEPGHKALCALPTSGWTTTELGWLTRFLAAGCLTIGISGTVRGQPEAEAGASTQANGSEPAREDDDPRPPVPQQALDAPYPEGAQGDAEVVLELLVSSHGHVEQAVVLEGDEPFASEAKRAAFEWEFEPALVRGKPRAARIRVRLGFRQPESTREPEPPEATGPAPEAEAVAPPPPPATVEISVEGVRVDTTAVGITREQARQLPGAFGDPSRAIEMVPGVTPTRSGSPYFFVRGAPPSNVGSFFDDIQVPALYHIGIGPAVLHPAFIDSVKLFPGAYPARYGRYAGAILAAQRAPARFAFRGEASVRLFDAGVMLETPVAGGAAR